MTKDERNKIKSDDITNEIESEIEEIENDQGQIDEQKLEEEINPLDNEEKEEIIDKNSNKDEKCIDTLAKTMADFDNFKKRVDRDKQDMIFFLKQDIFKKILPRLDDLERILKNTPIELQTGALFEGIISLEKKLKKDLETMGVKSFESIGKEVDPEKHDVMTTVQGKEENIIFDEFEKGYILGDRILRHAKVVVGAGE